jgi:hypothetical protein
MWRNDKTRRAPNSLALQKIELLAGSDPVWRACGPAKRPFGRWSRSRPVFAVPNSKPRRTDMPLLDPPKPEIPKRKYYVKIDEPLEITMEQYAEFIRTDSMDHVIAQALDFVFRKDTDFKAWLADSSGAAPSSPAKTKPAKPAAGEKQPENEPATAGATI